MGGFYNYGNVAKSTTGNAPGSCKILIGPLSYFASIATPDAPGAAGDTATISGTHTFDSGDFGWIQLEGNVKVKNTGTGTTVGELGSRTMTQEVTMQVAGLNAELLEFIEGGLNEEYIILVADGCACANGTPEYLQYGCESLPVNLTAEIGLGTIDGGFKGATLKFMSYGVPKVYTGGITLYS
jgi:hypothetical protein